MKAERNIAANTLRGTLLLRMANSRTLAKDRVHHPRRLPAFISRKKSTSIIKKLKRAGFKLPREAARSFKSLGFALRFGSGRPLPLINAWYSDYLSACLVRVYRRNYWSLTRSGRTNRRLHTWRHPAAVSSNVRYVSCSSTSEFILTRA